MNENVSELNKGLIYSGQEEEIQEAMFDFVAFINKDLDAFKKLSFKEQWETYNKYMKEVVDDEELSKKVSNHYSYNNLEKK